MVGVVSGVVTLDILFRVRAISVLGYAAGLAAIAVLEAGQVASNLGQAASGIIGAVGNLLPALSKSTSTGSLPDIIAPSTNNPDARTGRGESKAAVITGGEVTTK